jgi:tRNA (guanine-N7-)-methyltransferase
MEIRDKVTNFVAEKLNSTRINSQYKECMNGSVLRTNSMKTMTNYFEKGSINKFFFCFADPHFKKVNHRRRIINTDLLSDYAYVLKEGGKLYIVTDVKDLFDWEYEKLAQHPLYREIPKEETA